MLHSMLILSEQRHIRSNGFNINESKLNVSVVNADLFREKKEIQEKYLRIFELLIIISDT